MLLALLLRSLNTAKFSISFVAGCAYQYSQHADQASTPPLSVLGVFEPVAHSAITRESCLLTLCLLTFQVGLVIQCYVPFGMQLLEAIPPPPLLHNIPHHPLV